MRLQMVQAGFRSPRALETLAVCRAGLTLLLPPLMYVLVHPDRTVDVVLMALVCASLGYYLPWLGVEIRRSNRHDELLRVFPNALDLLVSCLEAGLGLDASLKNVAREIRHTSEDLADELDQVNAELAAGIPRLDALRNMDGRLGVEEVSSLVNVLAQAERFGTGIAQSIRAHAQLTRRKRVLRAEEKAARVAPRLTVAMVCFILPPLFIVLLGPAVVRITDTLLPTLVGLK
jgi:tight adherence protein C